MIGIVVINYRSEEKTIGFVKNELSKISSPNAVVIVDNGSTSQSKERLLEAFKGWPLQHVFVVPSKENLGFAKGNNLGAEVAVNQFDPDVLLFANNDISLTSDDVVDKMASKLLNTPEAGALGPDVVGLDGKRQSPEPFISFWDRHVWLYWSNLFMSKSKKEKAFGMDYASKAEEGFHYRVSGSFFMVKTQDWKACGGMDPNTFLYSEEMILSERLSRIGKKVYYYPSVKVVHEHGSTTRKYYDEVRIRMMKFNSECYYYKTYIGTPSWQIAVARLTYSLKRLFGR